MTKLPPMAW